MFDAKPAICHNTHNIIYIMVGKKVSHSPEDWRDGHGRRHPQCWPSQNSLGQDLWCCMTPAGPPRNRDHNLASSLINDKYLFQNIFPYLVDLKFLFNNSKYWKFMRYKRKTATFNLVKSAPGKFQAKLTSP